MQYSKKTTQIIIFTLTIILLFFVVFTGIFVFLVYRDSVSVSPENQRLQRLSASEYTAEMLKTAATGDISALDKYIDTSQLLTPAAKKDSLDSDKILSTALSNLTWNVLMADNIDADTVKVTVSVTTIDMSIHYGNAVHNHTISMLLSARNGTEPTSLRDILNSELDSAVHEYTEKKTDIILRRDGSGWKTEITAEFSDALLGGINNAIESLNINNAD